MKIIFLDRDGVINEYPGHFQYVTSWRNFKFSVGAKKALKKLFSAGYKIFVISNQAGVTKGIYSQKILDAITRNMLAELKNYGVKIAGVYYCIHINEDNCGCRKPKAGLIKKAMREHRLSKSLLKNTFVVGDSVRDIETGKNAGCRTILVLSGKENIKDRASWAAKPDFIVKDLSKAVDTILSIR